MTIDWLTEYSYLISAIGMMVVWLVVTYLVIKRDAGTGRRSIFEYLLLWPLLLEDHKKKATKNSNRFIAIGVIVMVLLVVADIYFHPETR